MRRTRLWHVAARLQHPRYRRRQVDKRLPRRQSGL